jgi:glycosyltransferase involved in cell wall biosynthesis
MKVVFVHQNMPGQYKHLAVRMAQNPENSVVFITKRTDVQLPNIRRMVYKLAREPGKETHQYLRQMESCVLYGQAATRMMVQLRNEGFIPDIIVGHSGWGEIMYAKDVFPRTPLLSYSEFYYRAHGTDIDFDPSRPPDLDNVLRVRTRNSHMLLTLEACDRGITPTKWQRSVHPPVFHPKIEVIHDGIDTGVVKPNQDATFPLADGRVLTRNDEVVTYVARNLEPYRGFPTLMQALPAILEARPNAQVLIVGGDETSYGSPPADAENWRTRMLKEVAVDPARVHFLGRVPYSRFLALLQVSSVHVYLTYPFVLSWSMIEAMSAGCVVVGSRTKPVEEVLTHGKNGLLVDFFDPAALAAQVLEVLADRRAYDELAGAARRSVLKKYDLPLCLTQQLKLIQSMI